MVIILKCTSLLYFYLDSVTHLLFWAGVLIKPALRPVGTETTHAYKTIECSCLTSSYIFLLHLAPGSMKMSSSDSYFYAAIVAVLAVHVVLALFVYVAWNEGAPKGKGKDD